MGQKNLKILLLSVNSGSFFYDQVVIPFGLISLASYIDNSTYEIKGIEMNNPPEKILKRYLKVDKGILKKIKNFNPEIVAMSTYASNMYNVLFWAKVIKTELPHCFTIIGGNHASYIASECLRKCPELDFVVRFEGEIPFKMICEKIYERNYDFSEIPSISYRINGKIRENPQIDLIKDLSSLPLLNRSFFKDTSKKKEEVYHVDIVSARGCPFNCTFCNCNHYWNKVYRVRLIDSVIHELKDLQEKYPNLKSVRVRDESITINKNRCRMLSEAIAKSGINLEFQAHSRLDGLDEKIIQILSKAGFKLLFIGMESGSQKVLNRLQKGIDISRAEEVVSLLRKYRINFRISFMSQIPNETFGDIVKTIKLIKKLKLKNNEYYIGTGVAIYPGTYEYKRFLMLNNDYEWISKVYNFKGKYYGARDQMGNILHPDYRELRLISTIFLKIFLYLILKNTSGLYLYFNILVKKFIRKLRNLFK